MPGSAPEKSKTILFDFDGTIAATVAVGVSIFNQLARQYGFAEITSENSDALRAKAPRAAMKILDIPILKVPLVLRALRRGVKLSLPSLAVIDGVRSALAALKEKGYRLGIVTTNEEQTVRAFLANHQMDYFDHLQAGIGLFGKASAIKKLIAREGLAEQTIAFVGDEIRDVEAAKKNNITAVGVTWGINSREGLASAEPDFIVDAASELLALFP
jgi:phosphoglycolate phosphatase